VLEPVVARYRDTVKRLYFRGDAAFANPEIYKFLEAEGMGYAIRLPANSILQSKTDTCSSARLGDRRMSCAATSPASAIRRKAGRNPDGSWRRSSGTPMSFIRGSASSSAIWRGQPSASSPSTISWHGGAMDQGRKGRDQMDTPVVPLLRRQRRASSAPYPRLQPGQFHADAGDAQDGGVVVADQPAREADQDRCQGRQPWPLRHLPNGRGRSVASDIPGNPVADRPAAGTACAT